MEKNSTMHLTFSKSEHVERNENLNVNFILYSKYSASGWYPYQKRITIMHNSKLLVNSLIEPNIEVTYIEILNPKQSLHYERHGDNVYLNIGVDTFESYQFTSKSYDVSADIKDGYGPILSNTEYLPGSSLLSLPYYDPAKAKYSMHPLSEQRINEISNSYTYDKLKESGKLLEEDILKLKNFTPEQIQSLILIHKEKSFRPFGRY